MLSLTLFALACLSAQDPAPPSASLRPLTVADALFTIEGVSGPVRAVADVDGDGLADLVVERGGDRSCPQEPSRLELVSTGSGRTLRTLWSFSGGERRWMETSARKATRWDAGGDVDGDGTPDVVVGVWRHGEERERAGAVLVVSGADGSHRHFAQGDAAGDGLGYSVTFLGDVDGDGHDDYAAGAPQARVEEVVIDRSQVVSEGTRYVVREEHFLTFKDGTTKLTEVYAQERLDARSAEPGYVSVRSGKDGAELVRFEGERAGHGFGTRIVALGDLDGDGRTDLGIGSANESAADLLLVSVVKGTVIAQLPSRGGPFGRLGDTDGDGGPELFQSHLGRLRDRHWLALSIVSGSRWRSSREVPIPDMWSKYTVIEAAGDVDGDGSADLAIGEANFHIPGPGRPLGTPAAVDLAHVSLEELVGRRSDPCVSMMWESGCAWIYSGATDEVIFGVYGLPGTTKGIGLGIASIADVNGDELPDLVVTDEDTIYVFAGPGAKK